MPEKKNPTRRLSEKRRGRILKAAFEVFSLKGFQAATIPEIAEKAGTAAGTIYLYYRSKRDLFVAVIQEWMISPLLKIFENHPADFKFPVTLREALADRLGFLNNAFLGNYVSLMSEVYRDYELKEYLYEQLLQPFFNRMEGLYRLVIKTGQIRRLDPQLAVRLVGSLMIGITILNQLEGDKSIFKQIPQENLIEELTHFILLGFTGIIPSPGERKDE
jgi:AcrR family transcriptional regulator